MKALYLIILFLASFSSTLFAQDCNNPLLGIYGLASLGSPQSGTGLPYCNNLQSGQTCCSNDTVSTFQGKLAGLVDNLNNYDAARDLYVAQLRNRFFDRFQDLLDGINDNLADNLAAIQLVNATLADQLQSDINNFTQINSDAQNINNQFGSAMDDFQAARNSCFTAALQVQASSWCLACDPNYATEGVNSDGTVTFSDGLCQDINDACLPYFNQSARFNPLIRAREAYWELKAVARYLNDLAATNQVVEFNVSQDPYNPLSSQQVVTVPDEWVAGGTEQCSDLWAGDQLLAQLLTIGNSIPDVSDVNENELVLFEEETTMTESSPTVVIVDNTGTRLLQNSLGGADGVWAPNLNVTGLDFSGLRSDPGDFFGVSDYSDYLGENENVEGDLTDDNVVVINST